MKKSTFLSASMVLLLGLNSAVVQASPIEQQNDSKIQIIDITKQKNNIQNVRLWYCYSTLPKWLFYYKV